MTGAAVLGAFFLLLGLGFAIMLRISYGDGELGTSRADSFAENVRVTHAQPMAVLILVASVDPADSTLDEIPVYLNLQTNRSRAEMWLAAIRLDAEGPTFLAETSSNVFNDTFPVACLRMQCMQTYALVACWRQPTAEESATVYFGSRVTARRNAGTPPGRVDLDLSSDGLPADVAAKVAQASGCEAAP